jgi:hypothetical protein
MFFTLPYFRIRVINVIANAYEAIVQRVPGSVYSHVAPARWLDENY